MNADVIVAGGGSAGLAAAVSAARAGAQVILLERHGFLGGMGTASLVHTICGLYLLREAPDAVPANPGFAMEVAERLLGSGGAQGPVRMGRVDVLRHDPVALAGLADVMVKEARGLRVLFHTEIMAAGSSANGWMVEAISRGTRLKLHSRTVVDGTGDATLTMLSGADWSQADPARLQRPAYVCQLAGVEGHALDDAGRLRTAHAVASAVKAGELPPATLGAGFRAGLHPGTAYLTLDLSGDAAEGAGYDPTDPQMLTQVEQSGRGLTTALIANLRAKAEGFASCWISAWPVRAGVRESRRLRGLHELSHGEVLHGAQFRDGIACIAWPLELRETARGPRWEFPEAGAAAQIPLRCLASATHPGLFAAGRCLSASHEALASVRVMGTCMATGEAAGIAAALVAADAKPVPADGWTALAQRVTGLRPQLSPC